MADRLISVPAARSHIDATVADPILKACMHNVLDGLPAADAVEVVRCKSCKHYKPQNQGAHRNCTTPYCVRVVAVKVNPDDFCSYGERKNND